MRFYAIWISFLCIFLYGVQRTWEGFTEAFLLNQDSFAEAYRFFTSIFLHGSVSHLVYNLFALLLFGLILEKVLGSNRMLWIFVGTGFAANLVAVFFYEASLGASGAIFGLIGALTMLRPKLGVFAVGVPMPLYVASIVWTIGNIVQTYMPTNKGTIAHLAGLLFGLIIGYYYRDKNQKKSKERDVEIPDKELDLWERTYMGKRG